MDKVDWALEKIQGEGFAPDPEPARIRALAADEDLARSWARLAAARGDADEMLRILTAVPSAALGTRAVDGAAPAAFAAEFGQADLAKAALGPGSGEPDFWERCVFPAAMAACSSGRPGLAVELLAHAARLSEYCEDERSAFGAGGVFGLLRCASECAGSLNLDGFELFWDWASEGGFSSEAVDLSSFLNYAGYASTAACVAGARVCENSNSKEAMEESAATMGAILSALFGRLVGSERIGSEAAAKAAFDTLLERRMDVVLRWRLEPACSRMSPESLLALSDMMERFSWSRQASAVFEGSMVARIKAWGEQRAIELATGPGGKGLRSRI